MRILRSMAVLLAVGVVLATLHQLRTSRSMLVLPSSFDNYDDDRQGQAPADMICISNGTVYDSKYDSTKRFTKKDSAIRLSSPFFRDFVNLYRTHNSGGCEGLVLEDDDGKTHVVISTKHGSQYGHLLLNGMAPLWDKLRQLDLLHKRQQIVLHYFTEDERYLSAPYIQQYLSLFADDVRIRLVSDLPNLKLWTKRQNLVLGLSNITTDHYNYDNADPERWKGFRNFLMQSMNITVARKTQQKQVEATTNTTVRVTFVQRKKNRRMLNLDELVGIAKDDDKTFVRVVSFEDMELEEQVRAMAETDVLIGADGTNLINGLLYMPTRGCVISILPHGVSEYIPNKGRNFRSIREKLGGKYSTLDSLPVDGSARLKERASKRERPLQRWFLLDQDLQVELEGFRNALEECVEYYIYQGANNTIQVEGR